MMSDDPGRRQLPPARFAPDEAGSRGRQLALYVSNDLLK
jgi:hypothetical protein